MNEVPGYQQLQLIGSGASALVYQAIQVSTGQRVALKILSTHPSEEASVWSEERGGQRFARELRLCASLHHPHIVRLIDQGVCPGDGKDDTGPSYAVFEYVPGHSLSRHLAQHGALAPGQTKELMLQALDALACAHASGIVHRDLKPQNLMVTETGARQTLKVLDFGIGAWLDPVQANDLEHLTLAHESLGTPAYSAPEQLRGEAVGPQSDLYAWGLIFLECLTGRSPLYGLSTPEAIHQQLSDSAITLPAFLAQHPLAELLRRVLTKDPARRLHTATEAYAWLNRLNLDDILLPVSKPGAAQDDQPTQTVSDSAFAEYAAARERRPLTLLSCKLKIVQIDAKTSTTAYIEPLLAEKLVAIEDLLARFGGYPAGGFGGGLTAYFGYPQQTDQDTRLAVKTALELHRAVQAWNRELEPRGLRCKLQQAIHGGMATLARGKPMSSELADVALAMLFMAPVGDILVSAQSRNMLRDQVRLGAFPEVVTLDGGDALKLYRLLDEETDPANTTADGAADTQLVGRAPEQQVLRQLWRDCQNRSSAALVEADAGLGKSALVAAFLEEVRSRGGQTMLWRCQPEYQHSALHPVLRGVEQLLGLGRRDSQEPVQPADQQQRLKRGLAEAGIDDANHLAVLGHWLNVPDADDEQRQHFSPERQKQLLYEALHPLILSQAAQAPLLLVIEDLHWIDSVSLAFVQDMLGQAHGNRLLLLMTTRPGEHIVNELQWVEQRLPLAPLADSDSQVLAEHLLGASSDLAEKLVSRSGGVPLFIWELAQLGDSQQIESALPLSLMDVLTRRINAIGQDGQAKRTLQWAAVAGHGLQADFLSRLEDADVAVVEGRLAMLRTLGLIDEAPDSAGHRYEFSHALYRDAAYQQITESARRRMHEKVAETLESSAVRDSALIARHFAEARSFDNATRLGLQAIRDDLGMALTTQAADKISDLMGWVEHLSGTQRHDFELQAYELQGQSLAHRFGWAHPSVLENVQKTQEYMQRKALLSTHKVKAATLWSLGMFYHVSSQRKMLHSVAAQLIEMSDNLLDDGLAILGHCLHGVGHWIDGNFEQSERDLLKVRSLYDPRRHRELARDYTLDAYVWASAALGLVRWQRGDVEQAHRDTQQAIDEAWAIQHMPSLGIALMYRAFLHHYEQDRERAAEVALELLELAQHYGLSAVLGYASAVVGWASDDLERITATLGQLKSLGCLLGVTYLQSMAVDVSLRQGDMTRTEDLVNEGLQMARDTGELYYLVPLYQQKARCLSGTPNSHEAVQQCLRRVEEIGLAQGIKGN